MSLTLRADRMLLRAGVRSRRFLCATVQAPEAASRPGRPPVNLAFVLDRSGSMHGEKIARAREAVLQGIRSLRDQDRFAVVAYDDHVELVVPTTAATAAARDGAARAVARIAARGQTDLAGGWQRGCEQVVESLSGDAVGRAILLTDGLANHGLTDHDEIVRQCAAWRERRVATTAFGVGVDFDETLLRRMADAGGGGFQFIESAVQIPDFVASEVGEALAVTAREAVLVVDAGFGAVVESVNEFPCRQDGAAWRVELGSLYGGQSLDALLRVTFPEGEAGTHVHVGAWLEDADRALAETRVSVRLERAGNEENDGQPRDREVDRRVAAAYAARAERDALERNRARDFEVARGILERCARKVESYAGDDPELREIVADLLGKASRYGRDMDGLTRKTLHSFSSRTLKGRHTERPPRRWGTGAPSSLYVVAGPRLLSRLEGVAEQLARAEDVIFGGTSFEVGPAALDGAGPPLEAEDVARTLERLLAGSQPAGVRVVFIARPFADNFFSQWYEAHRAAVVSVAGWERTFRAPLDAFLAYELVLHGLRLLSVGWSPERLVHDETRGCLFDLCRHRADIDLKLQAADLCPSCRQALEDAGAPLDRIEAVARVVRLLAAPSGVVH